MLLRTVGKGKLPPSGFTPPPWSTLSDSWDKAPLPLSSTIVLGPETITLGHNDSENDDASKEVENHEFEWENEHPQRQVNVGEFRIEWRPVTSGDFYEFYNSGGNGKVAFPESWCTVDGEVCVRLFLVLQMDMPLNHRQVFTMYGPVPMKVAHLWPVMTTYDDLSAYAIVKGAESLPSRNSDCSWTSSSTVMKPEQTLVSATSTLSRKPFEISSISACGLT